MFGRLRPRVGQERMDLRTRICIWVILIGLANFVAFSLLYVFIGGDAINGYVFQNADGSLRYELQSGRVISRAVFIYSGIHSITIWPTVGAVMLAMLTLAKDRIVSSMRSSIIRGRTMITILATLITLIIVVMTVWFILHFAGRLTYPRAQEPAPPPPGAARSS
jgi:hypothetical protein